MTLTKTDLYETDFYQWLETTAQLLQAGKFQELDIENLAEEVKALGRSEKRAVRSNLVVLLVHLLKWRYQPGFRSNSWRYTILEHHKRLTRYLAESPSLKPYYMEIFAECYQDAREGAAAETGLDITNFPEKPPLTPSEALDATFD